MNRREHLPNRRRHEVVEFEHEGISYTAAIGRFKDGRLAEVFINAGKPGCAAETAARDAAIAVSLGLQFGCPLDTIRHALTKLRDGTPAGPIGVALALFEERA